jgi:hypothetical protein
MSTRESPGGSSRWLATLAAVEVWRGAAREEERHLKIRVGWCVSGKVGPSRLDSRTIKV